MWYEEDWLSAISAACTSTRRGAHCSVHNSVWDISLGFLSVCMWACPWGQIKAGPGLWGTSRQLPYYVSSSKGDAGSGRMHRCTFRISLCTQPIAAEPESQHLSLRLQINAPSWSLGSEYQRQDEVLSLIPGSEIKHLLNPSVLTLIQSYVTQRISFTADFRIKIFSFVKTLTQEPICMSVN